MARTRHETAEAPAAAPRKRISADARRQQIIDVARTLFARAGIDATSMRRIAADAGVTAPLLYRHFADKDALLRAVCDGYFARLDGYMTRASLHVTTPIERLQVVMRAYVQCGLEHPNEYELTFMTALPRLRSARTSREARERHRRGETVPPELENEGTYVFGRLEEAVTEVILARRGSAAAVARKARSPANTNTEVVAEAAPIAEVIWAMGHGLVSLLNTHHEFGFSDRALLVDTSIAMVLNGVLAPHAAGPPSAAQPPRPRRRPPGRG